VLTEALSISRPVERKATTATSKEDGSQLSPEETAEVEDRLRALGYLG